MESECPDNSMSHPDPPNVWHYGERVNNFISLEGASSVSCNISDTHATEIVFQQALYNVLYNDLRYLTHISKFIINVVVIYVRASDTSTRNPFIF